jgi:hypothetical protein
VDTGYQHPTHHLPSTPKRRRAAGCLSPTGDGLRRDCRRHSTWIPVPNIRRTTFLPLRREEGQRIACLAPATASEETAFGVGLEVGSPCDGRPSRHPVFPEGKAERRSCRPRRDCAAPTAPLPKERCGRCFTTTVARSHEAIQTRLSVLVATANLSGRRCSPAEAVEYRFTTLPVAVQSANRPENLPDPFGLDRIKLSKIREPPCSHGVSTPPARCPGEATYTGFASSGCAALSGFLNLSALYSSPGRPGLISCR